MENESVEELIPEKQIFNISCFTSDDKLKPRMRSARAGKVTSSSSESKLRMAI
ncbi:MAG: hypothetical protein IPJ75_06810 [Ignavibacteriales bacterium]|nr:hypothetical protein [Ignavibacteriales bacterium]